MPSAVSKLLGCISVLPIAPSTASATVAGNVPIWRSCEICAASVAARAQRPFVVGFAAETHDVETYARGKLESKNLDLIAANEVGDDKVFDRDDNSLVVLSRDGRTLIGPASKQEVARDLIELIASRISV
jgi:phosphopantothenoylcysteine synthetase/decarboxylase